ncbi:MAG TPA: N,N-dimethylformamidase beta subunit family domain-containing protein [Actinomycetes bacterium]|nr:N,N-dimethylformamidase beta subunit family domain-containing protein [Actinomycetes bacterium]
MADSSIWGYCDRISVQPGESIRFMVSCEGAEEYRAEIVRLIHGDENPEGPGFKTEVLDTPVNGGYAARSQAIHAGSYVLVEDEGRLDLTEGFTLHAFIMPTTPAKGGQGILTKWSTDRSIGYSLFIDDRGRVALRIGDNSGHVTEASADKPLIGWAWYSVAATYDAASGRVTVYQEPVINSTNGNYGPTYPIDGSSFVEAHAPAPPGNTDEPFIMAGYPAGTDRGRTVVGGNYNGKLDRPRAYRRALNLDELQALTRGEEPSAHLLMARWDFADGISPRGIPSDHVSETSGNRLHGTCCNMPARGMTGYNYTSSEENFTHAPEEYGAIHFHDDDLEDAGWEVDFEFTVPVGMKSDVYAAHVATADVEDYIPFYVRPKRGTTTAKICFLAPVGSYLAYANEHLARDVPVAQSVVAHTPAINTSDLYLWDHIELGLSTYDTHSDGSGVCYSSWLRPIVNMRPKYRSFLACNTVWQFPADLCLIDWLNTMGHQYDVVSDEDLDREGVDLIRRYNVVLTGSHPEYYSTKMLDALESYVVGGGRLMYMGGNGFYWIISFHPEKRHLMEVRKAESGSRAWQARPGEYFHSTTGERGGLWRSRGRAPQRLCGVGFTTEGFDHSSYYRRMPDSFDARVQFIFEGIGDDELIGNFGDVGGGAAGIELDRYELAFGTPPNTLVLASSEGHSDGYPQVVEEIFFNYPGTGGTQNPAVRSDIVYCTTSNGGGVFSVGSIAFCGALHHNGSDNNVSRMTNNVLTRFAQDEPLPAI